MENEYTEGHYIDIGANLTDKMFDGIYHSRKHDNDLKYVLNRARKNNVDKIIITCGTIKDVEKSLEICEIHDPNCNYLYITVGIHPTNCIDFIQKKNIEEKEEMAKKEYNEFVQYYKNNINKNIDSKDILIPGFIYDKKDLELLEKLKEKIISNTKRVISIGEIGLDFDRLFFCPKYLQIKYFIYQLKLAAIFKLPLFLHMRNCQDIFFFIFDIYKHIFEESGAVIHSFTDSEEVIEKIQTYKNLYIGVNGCSLKKNYNINVVKKIPLNLLLLETDAPWCGIKKTHCGYQYIEEKLKNRKCISVRKIKEKIECNDSVIFSERNEPFNIKDIAEITYIIKELNIPFSDFTKIIMDNTMKLFKRLK